MSGQNQSVLDTIAKGASLTALGMVGSKAITYLYRTLIARTVGPEAYGLISIGLMIVSLGVTFSIFSFNSAVKNFIPKYRERGEKEKIRGVVSSAFYIVLPTSITASALLIIFSQQIARIGFSNPATAPIIEIFAVAIPFSVITALSLATVESFKVVKYTVAIRKIGQNILQLVASLALIIASYGVIGAAFGWVLGAIGGSIASFYIMEKKFGPLVFSGKEKETQYTKIFYYSYPLVLSGAIGSILGYTDTFFIGYYLPETEVGLYNAALPTAMLIILPYKAISSLVMPSMSETLEKKEGDLGNLLKTLTRWSFSISFPMFCLMALFSDQILHILFGTDYTSAGSSLAILAFGYLYSSSVGHLDNVIKVIDETQVIHKNAVLNFFINIGLNILLIPQIGIIGAAIATTGSIVFTQTLLLGEVYYFRNIQPFNLEAIKPAAASLISLGITWIMIESLFEVVPIAALIPGFVVFGTTYLILLYLLGGIKEEEINIIEKNIEKIAGINPREH